MARGAAAPGVHRLEDSPTRGRDESVARGVLARGVLARGGGGGALAPELEQPIRGTRSRAGARGARERARRRRVPGKRAADPEAFRTPAARVERVEENARKVFGLVAARRKRAAAAKRRRSGIRRASVKRPRREGWTSTDAWVIMRIGPSLVSTPSARFFTRRARTRRSRPSDEVTEL